MGTFTGVILSYWLYDFNEMDFKMARHTGLNNEIRSIIEEDCERKVLFTICKWYSRIYQDHTYLDIELVHITIDNLGFRTNKVQTAFWGKGKLYD